MSGGATSARGGGPVGQLPPQDWLTAPETQAVLAALNADGGEARFVGGCVRDAVLGRPIKDIDIASHDPPQRVMERLAGAGIHVIPTGIDHGTVTAVIGKAHFEITTLRQDVETFGRKARVAFTDDWSADAARRDFTMNALFADGQGRIYDPVNGLQDLGAGRVRFVGDAKRRIDEDVLRLLRYFRFHAHYGRPPMEAGAVAACRQFAPRLGELSGERVAGELLRLLQARDPASVMQVMRGERILAHILPEAEQIGRLRVLCWLESRAMARPSVAPDPLRRLAAVLHTDAEGARQVAERLKLANYQRDRLMGLAAPSLAPTPTLPDADARRALRKVGADLFRDMILLSWAGRRAVSDGPNSTETAGWTRLLDLADTWMAPVFPLKGQDCLELGVPKGRRIGQMLAAVEAWWEDEDYRPDRAACLDRLRSEPSP